MDRTDNAVSTFIGGFSCSQAVLSAFSEELALDRTTALKISTAFGAGMSGLALTCGAVTGALMVIGLKNGKTRAGDNAAKEKTYENGREFVRRFTERHKSIVCRELLGTDISTPKGKKRVSEQGLFSTLCPYLVADAVEILEEII